MVNKIMADSEAPLSSNMTFLYVRDNRVVICCILTGATSSSDAPKEDYDYNLEGQQNFAAPKSRTRNFKYCMPTVHVD